jgi:beta-1,4-mannooligosaccharide/beta-1,4-mannosyl-N-acetylglucosamine phosphorylase
MPTLLDPPLTSASVITRHPTNPILTARDVPYQCTLLFNAGVCRFGGRYAMVFRNDYGRDGDTKFDGTNLGLAFSDDGVRWEVQARPCITLEQARELAAPLFVTRDTSREIYRFYDPRLTVIDGRVVMCFAVDTAHGLRGGIAVTDDFEHWEVLSLTQPDNRNMVLFPEKLGGRYVRLDRPMPIYSRGKDRFDLWLSTSPDLRDWGGHEMVLGVEDVPFANDKVGPGAPPVRTSRGWLTTFHAVDIDPARGKNGWEQAWRKRYTAGIMLLDLDDPRRIVGMCPTPLIAPETDYEAAHGFRNHVIFPGGMILEPSGEVKIYYGAADTVECLATAHVDDLIALCEPVGR